MCREQPRNLSLGFSFGFRLPSVVTAPTFPTPYRHGLVVLARQHHWDEQTNALPRQYLPPLGDELPEGFTNGCSSASKDRQSGEGAGQIWPWKGPTGDDMTRRFGSDRLSIAPRHPSSSPHGLASFGSLTRGALLSGRNKNSPPTSVDGWQPASSFFITHTHNVSGATFIG